MIEFPGLQAVIVSSLTTLHYQHTVESLKRGVHVLCEKPVSHTVAEVSGNSFLRSRKLDVVLNWRLAPVPARSLDRSHNQESPNAAHGRIHTSF